MNKGFIQYLPAMLILAATWTVLPPLARAQDAVNPCEILNETIDCSGAGFHGAEIDFKTIKLNGKRKNDPMVNVDEALTISTGIRYKKRAKVERTTNFNGGCPPRVETKRIKPEAAITYSATLNGNTYTGNGGSFTVSAPPAIGSYPLVVTFSATAPNGCIDNAPLSEVKTFILDVIDGAYILSVNALTASKRATVLNGDYFLKGQGEEIDLSVTFSSPLSGLPFNANDIVWTVTPTSAGDFTGPNGANGDSVTWTQADDFVSSAEDDLILTVTAPNMQPKTMNLTVYSIESVNARVMLPNATQTFPISAGNIQPGGLKLTKVASRMNKATDVGNTDRIKLRTRTFTAPSLFTELETEMFLPLEPDQANPSLQIIKKATYSESSGTLLVEIQSGPVLGDVNLTWERNRIFGGRKILHREHVQVTSGIPGDTVTLVLDGTNDEGPLTRFKGDSVTVRAIPSAGSFSPGYPKWTISNTGTATINPPGDGDVTFPLAMLPPGEFTLAAKIGDDPSQKDTFEVYVYQVDLDVDADRDADVDDQDDAFEEMWNATKGAIFAVNFDDDDQDGAVDGMGFTDAGIPTGENFYINGSLDVDDIAKLVIPKVGSKKNVQFFLKLNYHDASAIHIFESRTPGAGVLQTGGSNATGWGAHMGTGTGPGVEIDITDVVQNQADVTLGIEGLFFPGGKVGTGSYVFDSEVVIELIAQSGTGNSEIIAANQIAMDKVKLRVAPFLFLPNTNNANEVFMDDDPGADALETAFGGIISRPPGTSHSQWYQDHVQIGFTEFPGAVSHVAFRFPYKQKIEYKDPVTMLPVTEIYWQDDWPEDALFGPDLGLYRFRNTLKHDEITMSPIPGSGDFGGNFEVVPYSDTWKLGRILHGDNATGQLETFFKAQITTGPLALQEPIIVNSSWLEVGHVDEMIGFAPTPGTVGLRPYKVVRADPQLAEKLLKTGANGIDPPSDYAAVFATGNTLHGTARNNFTTQDRVFLFDGASHGYIKFIHPDDINDGETVTISDGTTATTFEFEKSGGTTSGHVAVDISSKTSIAGVRTEFLFAINDTVTSNGLNLKARSDALDGIVVFNTNFVSGTQTISETVGDSGFMVSDMDGGETASNGVDFTGMAGGWVRIYKGPGAGQVAKIQSAGKGWLITDNLGPNTFDTSSQLIWDISNGNLGLFHNIELGISRQKGWFTEPGPMSDYVVAKSCKMWKDRDSGADVPGLWTAYELKEDDPLWEFNDQAQTIIDGVKSQIQTGMGTLSGSDYLRADNNTSDDSISDDPNDDFISVPTFYFGAFNGSSYGVNYIGNIVHHTAVAYNPGLSNFQPVSPTKIYFPKQFMAKNDSGHDVFEKACADIFNDGTTRAYFIDDWDVYHRNKGEIHCGTAAKRDCFPMSWWNIP